MSDSFDVNDEVRSSLEQALRQRGRVNILIAGRTGVGKSTLINAVFQGNLATTGQGRPVTQHTREVSKEGIPVTIVDTRGLELADYAATFAELEDFILKRRNDPDPQRHVHVAWVCLAEDLRRVELAESELVSRLFRLGIPVIGVITKARSDKGFRAEVQSLLPQATNVVRVRAIREELDDDHVLPPMGLHELVQLTMDVVPEGQRSAFAAAQRVDVDLKRRRAHEIVAAAAGAAATAGATPIPFADAIILVPIQITMLASITAVFGVPLSQAFLSALIASSTTSVAATMGGRAIVTGLLKFIPGVGTAAGAAISAVTASTLTVAFGEAYIAALAIVFQRDGDTPPSEEAIIAAFKGQLVKRM